MVAEKNYGENSTVFAKQNYCVCQAKSLCLRSKITVFIKQIRCVDF
jgi:hypothetical protein